METQEKPIWQQFYEDGQGFHRTVKGSLKRPQIFTPELVQNIAAMGIEKYFMAMFTRRGLLPRNHTMDDLVTEAKTFMALPEDLEASLRFFDSLQFICSIDAIHISKPQPEDILRFMDALDRIAILAEQELSHAADQDS
jgi:hypothetical protein